MTSSFPEVSVIAVVGGCVIVFSCAIKVNENPKAKTNANKPDL